MRTNMSTATHPERRRPFWMLLAIATNVAPLTIASLLASPLEPQLVVLLDGLHDAVTRQLPNALLAELSEGAAYYITVHTVYFVAPAIPLLLLLRFTPLRFGLALNRLTLALLVLGATGLFLRLLGGLYYHMVSDATHLSAVLGGFLDGLVFAGLLAGTLALVLSTAWYRWVQPRARWVRILRHQWAQL